VKTLSKRAAAKSFNSLCDLVHNGETVLIVDGGKPCLKMVPATHRKNGKSAAEFKARLDRISRRPIRGVSAVLKRVRE
jgi:antitoxin (DNA-binding transcriptional repressor) of toxin-antitoxin stability system